MELDQISTAPKGLQDQFNFPKASYLALLTLVQGIPAWPWDRNVMYVLIK